MSTTQTMTRSRHESQPSAPETFELSLKAPGRSLRELSRRVVGNTRRHDRSSSTSDEEDNATTTTDYNATNDVPLPSESAHCTTVQKWNKPKGNIARLAFACFSFIIAGLNDAAVGALIPYLESYYHLNYTIVSLIFLTPFAGYSVAAFTNASIHAKFGQRGIAIMAPICHIITYAVLSAHPPFPVLVVVNTISGFGNGLTDACFCAWVGVMDNANAVQGVMHSCYSVGALLAPLIATSMVVNAGLPWWNFYFFMIGAAFVEFTGLTASFWPKTGEVYRIEHPRENDAGGVGLGGWIVTFMLRVRGASPSASGYSGTGFWAGQALGRASLGFVTERFGERICITVYLGICLALQLVFWLVPQYIVSAVSVAFLGFFLGPLFPGCVMMAAKLLPKHIHVSAIGFGMAFGGTGGTVFPFIIGAIAASKGVKVLQPIILALIVVLGIIWLLFPRVKKRE
ncbi:MFS general substrate transporter, partial [Aureobasidium melanogenum]